MQISTKVVLNEAEIKEAVVAFVRSNLDLPGSPTFTVEFEDATGGDLSAVIDVVSDGAEPKIKEPAKAPVKRRQKAAAEPSQEADPKSEPETEDESQEQDPVTEPAAADDETAVADASQDNKTHPWEEKPAVAAAPVAAKSAGIFPSASTSAPEPSKSVEEDAAVKAKSLFANLPTNLNQPTH